MTDDTSRRRAALHGDGNSSSRKIRTGTPPFPRFFKSSYEPLFLDAGLSFSEKVLRWRTQPTASLHLLANVVMLSVLAVAVLSVG